MGETHEQQQQRISNQRADNLYKAWTRIHELEVENERLRGVGAKLGMCAEVAESELADLCEVVARVRGIVHECPEDPANPCEIEHGDDTSKYCIACYIRECILAAIAKATK